MDDRTYERFMFEDLISCQKFLVKFLADNGRLAIWMFDREFIIKIIENTRETTVKVQNSLATTM